MIASSTLTATAVLIFLTAAVPRLIYPFEITWGEGSMYVQIQRIVLGKQLYVTPSTHYVAWLYEPFFYFLNSLVVRIVGLSFVHIRIVSVLATIAIASMIFRVVYTETKKFSSGLFGIGLFVAAYGRTGSCLFVSRIDPLFVALLLFSFILVFNSNSKFSIVFAAIVFAISYFTKQTTLVFFPIMLIYLWVINRKNEAVVFSIVSVVSIIVGMILLESSSHGWFSFYTLDIPSAKAHFLQRDRFIHDFFIHTFLRSWPICIGISTLLLFTFVQKKRLPELNGLMLFGLFFLTALCVGFIGTLYVGGDTNILLPASVGCAIFLPASINYLDRENRLPKIRKWLVPGQLFLLLTLPWNFDSNVVLDNDSKNQEAFYKYVSVIPGEIWIPYHVIPESLTGKSTYSDIIAFQEAAIVDGPISRRLKAELESNLAKGHWSVIISDIKKDFIHYRLRDSIVNLNKIHMTDGPNIFIYKPESELAR